MSDSENDANRPAKPAAARSAARLTPDLAAASGPPPTRAATDAVAGAWTLHAEAAPDDALRSQIAAPLLAFNSALAGPSGHRTLALTVRDADGRICGGYWGATGYGWLYTQMLVVPEAARGAGLGRALMAAAEAEARTRGCRGAWVDTQFGARSFYEALGYRVFGELPDYPPGHCRTFLQKAL